MQQRLGVLGPLPAQYVAVQMVPVLRGQDAGARARAYPQHALGHERLDRLAQGAAAHSGLDGERVLNGQWLTGFPGSGHDAAAEFVDDPLVPRPVLHHDLCSPSGRH